MERRQEIERKQRDIERKKAVIEAQIAALRTEFETEKDELERAIRQGKTAPEDHRRGDPGIGVVAKIRRTCSQKGERGKEREERPQMTDEAKQKAPKKI